MWCVTESTVFCWTALMNATLMPIREQVFQSFLGQEQIFHVNTLVAEAVFLFYLATLLLHGLSVLHAVRSITRLDDTRGKKQVWRLHVRNWGLWEAIVLHRRKYFWHCRGFSTPPAVIRRPHSDSAPGELRLNLTPRYAPARLLRNICKLLSTAQLVHNFLLLKSRCFWSVNNFIFAQFLLTWYCVRGWHKIKLNPMREMLHLRNSGNC